MFDSKQLESLLSGDVCILKWRAEPGWPILERIGGKELLPEDATELQSLINPLDLDGAQESLRQGQNNGNIPFRRGPYRIATIDRQRWVSETSVLLPSEDKVVLSVLRDVSSDQALDEARQFFELAVDATRDGLWDWDLTTDRVMYSTRWKNMLGYEDNEIGESLNEWRSRVQPEDLERVTEALERHLAGHTRYYVNEHRMRRKDGSIIWILDRGLASRDEFGRPVRMVGFHTDITKHRELEDSLRFFGQQLEARVTESTLELRRQLNKFQLIFNASTDAFLIHYLKSPEHSDDFIEVNDRAIELFGYNRKQFEAMQFSMLFPPEEQGALKNTYETILNAGKVMYQARMLASKGQLISVELSSHIFRLAEGWACFSSVRDIGERLRLEEENEIKEQTLIQQSRMAAMGEMIGAIAHQWKQPLNAISMAAGMILDSESREELAETEEIIIQQVDFLNKTINDFRDFFRPDREESVFLVCEAARKLM
ncbi:MAG: PAS domain-containing protein, partial [Leptospiraceae bacterium]|nr:PAS domain-containing protein [Leptospiraceae bacterium]